MSEKENKRYYWLKMNEDFFEEDTIKFIREQENGEKYLIIYLILCLKSLRTEGIVIRIVGNTLLAYDDRSLAAMTGSDIDTVRSAITLFRSIGLVDIMDGGAIHMAQLKELVGSETESARKMRKSRAMKKIKNDAGKTALPDAESQCDHNVSECDPNVTQSIESRDKSLDIREKIIERESNSLPDMTGKYGNIYLSPEEMEKLQAEYPFTYKEQIDHLSEQKKIHGYTFASDYAVLLKWQREDDWDYREDLRRDEHWQMSKQSNFTA